MTVRPAPLIFICVAASSSYVTNLPSITEHNLNWNVRQAWRNLCSFGILSNKDSWCLVPFSSNISCDRPQRVFVVARTRNRGPYRSQRHGVVLFQRGAYQENCVTKHAVCRRSCDSNAWQSEWGFHLSNVDCCYYELRLNARRSLKREWKVSCCIANVGDFTTCKNVAKLLFMTYIGS